MANTSNEFYGYDKNSTKKVEKPKGSGNWIDQEQVHVFKVNTAKNTAIFRIPVRSNKKLVAWGEYEVELLNQKGIATRKAKFGKEDSVKLFRQESTDISNDIRRPDPAKDALEKFKAGKATSDEFSKVVASAGKGKLGKELQAELEALMLKALNSSK